MAHQDVTRTIQCQVNYFLDNNNAANIFHCLATSVIDVTLLDDIAGVINGWLTTDWAPLASDDWTANEIVLTGLNSLSDPRKSYPIAPPIPGTLTDIALPANVTLAIKEDVGHRGKGIAGRWFWVGFAGSQVVGDSVLTASATAIIAALQHLNTLLAAVPGCEGMCVPHLVVNRVRPNPASSDLVASFVITDNTMDSQRDRLPFHKRHKKPIAAV